MAKAGRKPRGEYGGKSAVFSTRLRPDTKEALARAAEASGRSLSQEVEYRLRRSFDEDESILERLGGRQHYALFRLIAVALGKIYHPDKDGATWLNNPYVFEQTLELVTGVLRAFRPQGEVESPWQDTGMQDISEYQGFLQIGELLAHIVEADANLIFENPRRNVPGRIKGDLGDIVDRVNLVAVEAPKRKRRKAVEKGSKQ